MSGDVLTVIGTTFVGLMSLLGMVISVRGQKKLAESMRMQEERRQELTARRELRRQKLEEQRKTASEVRLTSGLWLRELDETRHRLERGEKVDYERLYDETRTHREAVYRAIVEAAGFGMLPSGGFWSRDGGYVPDGVPMFEAMGRVSSILLSLASDEHLSLDDDETRRRLQLVHELLEVARDNREHGLMTVYSDDPE